MTDRTYTTKSGKTLTDADIEQPAEEEPPPTTTLKHSSVEGEAEP